MQSLIIPLVKCKSGDLSLQMSIIIELLLFPLLYLNWLKCIIADQYTSTYPADKYQVGFKTGHSSGLCTNTFKQTIIHYTNRRSHVFVCFVDFSQAYDKVNYWKLINMLLDDGISIDLLQFLAFWYSHQEMYVKWNSVLSDCFTITNDTRQGGVLSPYLFRRYIRDMIHNIACCHIGCNIGDMALNILAWSLSPSWRWLQYLIDRLLLCAEAINMTCNDRKTVCMVFSPCNRSQIVLSSFPMFKLGTSNLQLVPSFRYLGYIITETQSDNDNIQREIKNTFILHVPTFWFANLINAVLGQILKNWYLNRIPNTC